ncbi:hypothetical protein H8356DRAFT_1670228 [Neocallimastix lanati (nom. inval.)]|nr:hypothetical protein H8356DRAFT_1670228 [Neocallimastix sp. JGI-2020a]
MKMPATSTLTYSQTVLEPTKYDDNKPKFNCMKKMTINPNVGAVRTEKLDSYTLSTLSKFMTYSFYSIWDNTNNQDIYCECDNNDLISYIKQQPISEVNPNFEYFQEFCEKILGATETSFSLCLCALKLIDRLRARNCNASGSDGFEYRIFIAAYIIAYKFFTERSINNKAWEPICGMDVSQINIMEIEMLYGISFNINITSEEFIEWIQEIDFIFSNNPDTVMWYNQEIKPILSTVVRETGDVIMNDESIACYDYQDTNVEFVKPSTSKPMNCYRTNSTSSNSTLVASEYEDSIIDLDEDSLDYSLSPLSVTSTESSFLTR